jgi:3-oxoacyl-[acyl-carrier-protein] synthase II
MKKRVVVTGLGAITPIGSGKAKYWKALCDGKSGIDKITHFDASQYSSQVAGEVKDFEPQEYIGRKDLRRMDRFIQFALGATTMAIEDAKLEPARDNLDSIGVIVGSGVGGISTITREHKVLLTRGPKRVSPFMVPMMLINMASGMIAIRFGFKGPNSTVVTACATGTHAIGDAFKIIQRDAAEVMVCGGSEAAVVPVACAGFCSMGALSTRNEEPQRASRPFDAERDGFIVAEGAGIIILESLEHALRRDAHIYSEVMGYGMSGDAYHISAPAPGGEGAAGAIRAALDDAGLPPSSVDYINAHGTSTPLNDKTETLAIKRVFGDEAYRVAISSIKSMTGHLLGAAGGIEAIASVLAIEDGAIPPTINYENPDPDCDLDYVPNKSRKVRVDVAISNSFGFGGHNAVLIFKRYEA